MKEKIGLVWVFCFLFLSLPAFKFFWKKNVHVCVCMRVRVCVRVYVCMHMYLSEGSSDK